MATTAEFAAAYCRRYGIAVVKIEPGLKAPRGNAWNQPGGYFTDAQEAADFFTKRPDWNLGAVLGPSGLCSIDVDNPEFSRLVFGDFGIDIDALADDAPTIVGNPARFRVTFKVPAGVELTRKALSWPNPNDPDGSIHGELIRQAVAAKAAGDEELEQAKRAEAKPFARVTVFELRAGLVQDVLPPSMHPETGKPYSWRTRPNGVFPELPRELLAVWQQWEFFKRDAEKLCPWLPKAPAPTPRQAPAPRQGDSVIDAYNAATSIEQALGRYGYERRGRRWLSPHSGTGLPGINLLDGNKCYIHHASDPLCSDSSGKPVGPFDLFCYYEHGGDVSKAVRQAADLLGLERRPMARAPVPTVIDPDTGEILEAPAARPLIFAATPMTTAELFREQLPADGRIVFWREEFYQWTGHRYSVREKTAIHQQLYHWMASCLTERVVDKKTGATEVVAFSPRTSVVEDVMHALRAVCYIEVNEPPTWLESEPGDPPTSELVAFRNGFLHLKTRVLTPSTSRLFITSALDYDYDAEAPRPDSWHDFLAGLWPDDGESRDALAEVFGYMLTDDTSQQKMFMLIGPPRCGKGTILRVLESMVGAHNRVSPSLAGVGTQFGLQPLIGKRVAMISDARLSGKADQQPIVENMLRISGEDAVTIDRKNKEAWSGKLPTRFMLASNELPAFSDASSALANRFVLFKFTRSFLGSEDPGLTSRLLKELPGVVLWALEGLDRLHKRGYLLEPAASREMAQELREQTSPVSVFVAEKCILSNMCSVERGELFTAWRDWCATQGRDHPGTIVSFGRQLNAAFPAIGRTQPRTDGTRLNLYTGIRLRRITDADGGSNDQPF